MCVNSDSEAETDTGESIAETVNYILKWSENSMDVVDAIGARGW